MTKHIGRHGGNSIAEVLQRHGVRGSFTLCGGHISPILTGCNELGIRVLDVRHEAAAVFAADSVSRLSGIIGVAAVAMASSRDCCKSFTRLMVLAYLVMD